jgi:GMP synthase-like glutamine amidotransferase
MHILLLKGKGHEWGPVYRDYLSLFTHDQAEFSEVDIADIIAVNEAIESSEYAGYVITGSTDDAHDSADYVLNLIERVKELFARDAVLIGICYGHQVS